MVDLEQDIMGSNADFDLRSKISSVKEGDSKGIPKKFVIIGGSVIGAIIVVLLLFLLVFNTQNVKFTFYLNDAIVTENLDVTVSYEDTVLTLTTSAETLEVVLPKKVDVTLEVTSVGYQTKQIFFIEEDVYDVKIVKPTTVADLGGEELAQDVSFYVYKASSISVLYTSPISLSLKCLSSGKTSSLVVSGSKDYTKPTDCGSLQVTGNPTNFKAINQTCTGSLCNIILYDQTDLTPQEQASGLKNNLIVKAVTHKKQEAMDGVHVYLEKGVEILSDGNTDMNGEIIFYDVPVGTYTVLGEVKVKSKTYQEQATVEVYASSAPVKATLEFDLKKSSGGSGGSGGASIYEEEEGAEDNTLYLTVNTFDGQECGVGVDVFDVNGSVDYTDSINTGEEKEIGGIEDGKYYLGLVPLEDCSALYSPIYNKEFEMPKDQQMEITLEEFDKDNLIILIVSPKYNSVEVGGVTVDVYDSDLNQNKILSDMNPNPNGEVGFVLHKNKKYNILGNKNDAYKASVLNYNFPTAFLSEDGENYWLDNLDLNLTHESAEVTFNVFFNGVPLSANKQFTISANIADLGDLSYTGTGPSKKIEVPKGTETLFKVSYLYENKKNAVIISKTNYNYYLNPLTFSSDANLEIDFSESLTKPKTFLPKIYLDKALTIDANNLNVTSGTQYYAPFDVISSEGFLGDKIFAVSFEDLKSTNFFEFDESEAYSLNTEDFNFYSAVQGDKVGSYLLMEGDKMQKDIFRVVLPIKIKPTVPANSKGYLKYTQALPDNQSVDGNIEFWTGGQKEAPQPQGDFCDPTKSAVNPELCSPNEQNETDEAPKNKNNYDTTIDVYIGKDLEKTPVKQSDSIFLGTDKYCSYEVTKAEWKPLPSDTFVIPAIKKNLIKEFGLLLETMAHIEDFYSYDSKTGLFDVNMKVNQDNLTNIQNLPDKFDIILVLDLEKTTCILPATRAYTEDYVLSEEKDTALFAVWQNSYGGTGPNNFGYNPDKVPMPQQTALNPTLSINPVIFNSSAINKVGSNIIGNVFKAGNINTAFGIGGKIVQPESADKITKQVYVTFVLHKDPSQQAGGHSSPQCNTEVDCKADFSCDGKKIKISGVDKYCIWSKHPNDVNNQIIRKGLCNATDFYDSSCIAKDGTCKNQNGAYGDYVCSGTGWKLKEGVNGPQCNTEADCLANEKCDGKPIIKDNMELYCIYSNLSDKPDDFSRKGVWYKDRCIDSNNTWHDQYELNDNKTYVCYKSDWMKIPKSFIVEYGGLTYNFSYIEYIKDLGFKYKRTNDNAEILIDKIKGGKVIVEYSWGDEFKAAIIKAFENAQTAK